MEKAIYPMLEADQQEDRWDTISDEERAAIEVGLKQAKKGETTPHEVVMKKYSKWLSKQNGLTI